MPCQKFGVASHSRLSSLKDEISWQREKLTQVWSSSKGYGENTIGFHSCLGVPTSLSQKLSFLSALTPSNSNHRWGMQIIVHLLERCRRYRSCTVRCSYCFMAPINTCQFFTIIYSLNIIFESWQVTLKVRNYWITYRLAGPHHSFHCCEKKFTHIYVMNRHNFLGK